MVFAVKTALLFFLLIPYPVLAQQKQLCVMAGCSAERCVERENAENTMSACVWREEYKCLKEARCEVQNNGECEWTETEKYKACIENL